MFTLCKRQWEIRRADCRRISLFYCIDRQQVFVVVRRGGNDQIVFIHFVFFAEPHSSGTTTVDLHGVLEDTRARDVVFPLRSMAKTVSDLRLPYADRRPTTVIFFGVTTVFLCEQKNQSE